jgi:acyl-coenzyme A synthetase/AMP-(fatty) acid ligase
MPTALHTLLAVGRSADHPVCHDGRRFITWAEFSSRVGASAANFMACAERRWLITADNPLDFAILFLALLHSGKQVVIPPNTQPGTLVQLGTAFDAIAADPMPCDGTKRLALLAPIDACTAIIDIYTSGSTGEPKRIRKTLAQFETEVGVLESLWGEFLGQATVVASVPHYHFYGLLFRLLWPLAAGRPFDVITCAHPDTLSERLALLRNTAFVSSPALLSRLPELVPLESLQPPPRIMFSSGGPLPDAAAREFHRHVGRAPTEVFGSTETGGIAWRRQEDDDSWTPMPGIQVSREADGALSLRSPYLLESTPFRMEDAVELLPDGRFLLRGRLDRIVKIEEKRLSLPDMEARLAAHPWVAAAAAVVMTATRRQSIGAVVILTPQGRQQLVTIGRRETGLFLRRHLAEYFEAVLLPRRWSFPEHLPINERGKLTHAALKALFKAEDEQTAS